jgi:hypothetical protein
MSESQKGLFNRASVLKHFDVDWLDFGDRTAPSDNKPTSANP